MFTERNDWINKKFQMNLHYFIKSLSPTLGSNDNGIRNSEFVTKTEWENLSLWQKFNSFGQYIKKNISYSKYKLWFFEKHIFKKSLGKYSIK